MTYDPDRAAIIQLRLDIGQLLDDSAELSLLQRAQLRMELLRIVTAAEQQRAAAKDTAAKLTDLHERLTRIVLTPER
ncbi:hypothetical protein AX769_20910 (plasmid) [Frondihabitans sp. PAMC 28766]|uniref:hypothetical protein n=1 Tax=Frondihabitans sp. PAMC 28766 TaxID=1795630 RepID=UPI00078BD036|nr:hypothetical protein [Frondihabitans sp. PAMC 28766]AMM22606.1 hypothetical protein AX769_20910 [Frondihabitans sp. PAMC 28766]